MTPEELADRCDTTATQQPLPNDTDLVLKEAARRIRDLSAEVDAAKAILEAARTVLGAQTKGRLPDHIRQRIQTKTVTKPVNPLGCGLKVYLVEDVDNAPGRVMAVMADEGEANEFAEQLPDHAEVRPRKLWYGQPTNRGYNE